VGQESVVADAAGDERARDGADNLAAVPNHLRAFHPALAFAGNHHDIAQLAGLSGFGNPLSNHGANQRSSHSPQNQGTERVVS
jgi:hypothetical protein